MTLFGGIEAGGTKFNCIIGTGPTDIRAETRIPTTNPRETIGQVLDFYRSYLSTHNEKLTSMGIASFGPVDLDPSSQTWGYITSTPKPGWADTNLAQAVGKAFGVPVAFDTDVNGAGIGEGVWGHGKGLNDFIYMTIGTGIGGGAIVAGKPVHGLVHTEMGHIRIPHDRTRDPYPGFCPFHRDCFEGLATGPAMQDRWGEKAENLPPNHSAWDLEAHYIAMAVHTLVCVYSPQRVILGGGVMQQTHLFPRIHKEVQESLNGYVRSSAIIEKIDEYIVPPGLGGRAGVLGALAMARQIAS